MTEITPEAREFASFILDRAATHEELSVKLRDLVEAVRDTGKKGTLQLTLSLELFDGDPDRVVVNDKIVMKLPEHDRKGGIFFPDHEGNLSKNDPNTLSFDSLRDVNQETGEIKEV